MSLEADYLVDRRGLRRKLLAWRVLAFLAAAAAVIALGLALGGRDLIAAQTSHIARVVVEGLITGDRETLALIRRVKENKNAVAVLVQIDSPGGTTSGSEAIHLALRDLAQTKPTVAVVKGAATSGSYIAAMATDRIIAPQTALIGSIGVILQYPNVSKLLDTVGVKIESVRSTPLKAQPSGYEPTPPEARAALEASVADSYAWFRDMVKERRALSEAEVARVADGRVFTGRQSLALKLIDQIGGEKEAQAWLESEKGVAKSLTIRDYRRQSATGRLGVFSGAEGLAAALGFERLAALLRATREEAEAHSLDGLLSIWQPPREN
jgi:protease-4